MAQHTLDVRKLLCPMPLLRVQQALKLLAPGDTIVVLARDPGVLYDIPVWCRMHGYTVLSADTIQKDIQIEIALPF